MLTARNSKVVSLGVAALHLASFGAGVGQATGTSGGGVTDSTDNPGDTIRVPRECPPGALQELLGKKKSSGPVMRGDGFSSRYLNGASPATTTRTPPNTLSNAELYQLQDGSFVTQADSLVIEHQTDSIRVAIFVRSGSGDSVICVQLKDTDGSLKALVKGDLSQLIKDPCNIQFQVSGPINNGELPVKGVLRLDNHALGAQPSSLFGLPVYFEDLAAASSMILNK